MKPIFPYRSAIATEIAAALIGGGLAAAGTATSASINAANAGKLNKKNRDWQEKMWGKSTEFNAEQAELAHQRQLELQGNSFDYSKQLAELEGKNKYQWMLEDLRNAGLNPMLALSNGVSGGVGGISTPSGAQAQAGNTPMPTSHFAPVGDLGLTLADTAVKASEAKLNEAKADEIRGETAPIIKTMEEQETHIKEINGKMNLMLAQAGLFKSQQANTDANTKWQDIQNGIAEATKDYQAETIKWQLYNLRKDYEIAVQEIINWKKSNELKTQYLESQINLFNQQARLAFANIGLTETATETEKGRDKYMEKQNTLLWLQMPSLIDMAKWQCKNEMEFKERYDDFLQNQRRGQNMQLIGDVIKGVVGAGTSFYNAGRIAKGLGAPVKTFQRRDYGEGWSETETYTTKGLGL